MSREARTYVGRSSSEVLRQIRRELGEDVVILSSRTRAARRGAPAVVEITAAAAAEEPAPSPLPSPVAAPAPAASPLAALLAEQGVDPALIRRLVSHGAGSAGPSVQASLARAIEATVKLGHRATVERARRMIAFVGPTGVGKTTTIAKLATLDSLRGLSVGLITLDHHRIGGIEQLRTYGNLVELPVASPSTPDALIAALRSFSALDRVYIDTAGCGLADHQRMDELERMLGVLPDLRRVLLLPASGNDRDLRSVVQRFLRFGPQSVGITKTDETSYFGPSFSAAVASGLPIEILTTGQQVPEDVEWARASKLAELLCHVVQ